jgi:ParB family chromosome partitioning protein
MTAKTIPKDIIEAIGPAAKMGRRSWVALADLLKSTASIKTAKGAIKNPDFLKADSDRRFQLLFRTITDNAQNKSPTSVWRTPAGHQTVRITHTPRSVTLAIDKTRDPDFAEFLIDQLDTLYNSFQSSKESN